MERELIGHRQSRRDMVESYENYDRLTRTNRSEPRQWSNSGVRAVRLTPGDEYREFRASRNKPGAGLGLNQGRKELLAKWTLGKHSQDTLEESRSETPSLDERLVFRLVVSETALEIYINNRKLNDFSTTIYTLCCTFFLL